MIRREKALRKGYSSFFDHRRDIPEPEPELDEFKNSIEKGDPVLGNMDVNMLKKLNDDKDKSD